MNLSSPIKSVAIIGGSSLAHLTGMEIISVKPLTTPFGKPSANILYGTIQGIPSYFLNRHGSDSNIAPHKINYRANIWALKELGVETILAVTSVGGITHTIPGELVVPTQLIDYTHREPSFYDGENRTDLNHIDFAYPFSQAIARTLLEIGEQTGVSVKPGGVYGVTQGPRLETIAEIERIKRDGCDLVGMTAMPEASLAKELGIEYGNLSLIVNPAAGCSDTPLNISEIRNIISHSQTKIIDLIGAWLAKIKSVV